MHKHEYIPQLTHTEYIRFCHFYEHIKYSVLNMLKKW